MSPARRVVITGTGSVWGATLARRLERDPEVSHVAGIDTRPPPFELERTELIEADIRSPVLSRLLPALEPDTLVHCGILWYPEPGRPPRVLHEINVIGTLQLLAACERTESLRRIVVRGSAAIYGSEGPAPFFFTEEMTEVTPLRTRFQRDISELEEYFSNFARRHPELVCCMLRCQPEIAPELASPLVRYLTLPRARDSGAGPRARQRRAERRDLTEQDAEDPAPPLAPDPASAVRADARAARPKAGGSGFARRRRPPAALRARDRQPQAAHRARLRAAVRRGRGDPRPGRQGSRAQRLSRSFGRGARRPADGDRPMTERSATLGPEALADFLRDVRGGVEAGLDPLEAARDAATGLPRRLREAVEIVVRRLQGDYHEDEWGFDEQFAEAVFPLFEFLYGVWWRVEVEGVRNVPAHGRALLVANHAGSLFPFDAAMMTMAIMKEHPLPRWPRFMVLDWAFVLPFASSFMRRCGGVPASPSNAIRLLEQNELVMAFPEGIKGTGKPFAERYRVQRFGRGGFVEIALRAQAPIVPVAVVGAEEIYPKIGESRALARAVGAPYVPITPTFPWLGPFGLVPLPSRWRIEFCDPVELGGYGPEAAEDRRIVFDVAEQVRETIQETLYENLVKRRSTFL
jgi:1-acyl-sn-glycerol-3-phosphate acyltransferase